jgi:arginine deiminase
VPASSGSSASTRGARGSTAVCIESEIGPLKRVVVHRPGDEVVRMTQHELHQLLFDDILSPAETVREHDLFVEILARAGAEVIEVVDLIERALSEAPVEARERLLSRVCDLGGARELAHTLLAWSPDRLASALVSGVYWRDVDAPPSLGRIRASVDEIPMALRPVPNLMFMRDPCVAIGDHLLIAHMATAARAREPLLAAFAFEHTLDHPSLLDGEATGGPAYRSIEGGDVTVLSPEVLLVGCSQRTRAETVERIAGEVLFPALPRLERIYAVMMPDQRSMMHLDTVLTQIDERLFLGHRPFVEAADALPVARLERAKAPTLLGGSILDVLRDELGEVALVPCGGDDRLHQEREQWTDGANAVCLSPGKIILYARNVFTIEALRDHGFDEVRLHVAQGSDERHALIDEGLRRSRTVFSFSGSELSRARGGGRCLTMPLYRDSIARP